jgi:DNA polymerase III epsilon subunit-like protein
MKHVMVDIETLGLKPGSVILSIGACRFDEGGVSEERFYRPIDVFDSLMTGLKVDEATVGFWRMQLPEARSALSPGRPLRETLEAFAEYVKGVPLLWAKGPDFDLVLLDAACEAVGMKKPWSYRVARDVRTMLALAPSFGTVPEGTLAHHALSDAVYQATQVIAAAKELGVVLSEMA